MDHDHFQEAQVMGSETPNKAPVIDFTDKHLTPGTSAWVSARNDIKDALEKLGIFVIVYDQKIPQELSDGIYRAFEEAFEILSRGQIKYTPGKAYLGFDSKNPRLPLYQNIAIGDTSSAETVQEFKDLIWPSGKDDFCGILQTFTKHVAELQDIVMKMVFESYGLEKYYEAHKGLTSYNFRVNKYRVPELNENNVGLPPHTDSSFITILHLKNQARGLEVQSMDGNWISIDFPPSSFAVLAGDAIQAWSSGNIRSCIHRATMLEKESRYSISLFVYLKGIIQTPEELVDATHPLLYKPFDHFELLHFVFSNGLQGIKDKVKLYCDSRDNI